MKLLLTTLNSKYVHSNLALKYLRAMERYGAAGDEPSNLTIDLQEYTINNEMTYIYTEILRGGYDIICFSCYIWNVEKTKELCRQLKQAEPSCRILLGGPEVSYDTEEFMYSNPYVDFVLRGEGEPGFREFCHRLPASKPDFSEIPGLCYRENGQLHQNPVGSLMPMESIPFPYGDDSIERDKVIYYESSRGCPYRCSYCISSIDKTIRVLPLNRVKKELDFFLRKRVKQVKFIDRTFNFDRDRTYEIWEHLIEHDNGVTNFHFELCGDLLDDRLFKLLERARQGIFQFEIGIQSTSRRTLEAVNRKGDVSELFHNIGRLVKLGNSHIHVDLIAGLPYEDFKTFGASFDQVFGLGADNLQLGFLKLLKGTEIREKASEHKYVFRKHAPYEIISNGYISSMELVRLKMIENVLDLYWNKGGFRKSLQYIKGELTDSWFTFFGDLAGFYYDEGFQHRSHSKEDLYRILFKFSCSRGRGQAFDVSAKAAVYDDLRGRMNFDAVKKFDKKGWEI